MKLQDKIKNGVYIIAEMSANHAGSLENALELVKVAKDCGSAAAFVSSIMVFIICCFIFVPKIIALF